MMLLEQFTFFIEKQSLVQSNQKVLLAVSGGVDSVVMAYLFHKAKFDFGIAHCNFKLRGSDSDKDEAFVQKLSKELLTPFYSTSFNTFEQAKGSGESVQMITRRLRYEWLEKIRKENHYDLIATAHHHDDNIETLLINMLRGTGIHGLRGIPPKNINIIRPVLFATRYEIEKYAKKHNIAYRTDKSNKEDKYIRNVLRNRVITVFEKINPRFRDSFKEMFKNIELPYICFLEYIEKLKKELLISDNERFLIPLEKLNRLKHPSSVLYELLKDYGFNRSTIENVLTSLEKQPGKRFYGGEYCLLKDRDHLILFPETKNGAPESLLIANEPGQYRLNDIILKTDVFDITGDLTFPKDERCAFLDFDKLLFPLELRPWEKGDVFQPLGMNGNKKVSDFLIDKKISIDKKGKTYVMCSGKNIVWVAGYRINEQYKIDESSRCCFFVQLVTG